MSRSHTGTSLGRRERRPRPGWAALEIISNNYSGYALKNKESRGRGIGPGLDWRGDGGFVIVPSPGSGYDWDPHWNFDTAALALVPAALLPRQPEARLDTRPIERTKGLSPYVEAALERACRTIIGAPTGQQEETLNGESFSIGRLAGASGVPAEFARRVLHAAARQIHDYERSAPLEK
jgi:hypothetical protein